MSAAGNRPLRDRRWAMLALVFVCRTGLGLQFQTLGSVSEPLVAQMGFSYAEIGMLIGLFMLPGLVLAFPAGYAGRLLSDRSLATFGLGSLALGGALASLAQGFDLLALGRIAAGVGFVFSTVYFAKMVTDWFAGRELATAMSVLVMSWPFGIAIGQVGHAWIAATFDWRVAFAVAAAYCAVGALLLATLYRPPPDLTPTPGAATAGLTRPEWMLTLIAAAVWGLFNAGYVVYLSFAPQVLLAQGYRATDAAAVVSLASWVMIFSGTLCGHIADRTGRRDLIFAVCAAIGIASMLMLQFGSLAIVAALGLGLFGAAPAGIIMALTGEAMAPQRRAFGMGIFYSGFFVLQTAGPPIAGWLFDRSHDPYVPIVFGAALFTAAAGCYALFRIVRRRVTLA